MAYIQNEKNIILLSELRQIEELKNFLLNHSEIEEEGFLLISLDLEVEYVLQEKGIPFQSARGYRAQDAEPLTLAEEWVSELFENERWKFFSYRGVSLAHL